jgi:iron-regulated transporter 1
MFEFGAVLFLARIFPSTQLYTSIYALVRAFAAIFLSNYVGTLMDRTNRLAAIRNSIVWQRIPGQ